MTTSKYYPSSYFLSTGLGNRPSYTWRWIIWEMNLALKGGRWRVGDGKSIGSMVLSLSRSLIDTTVKSLISDESWNEGLLTNIFSKDDVDVIQCIPLCLSPQPDSFFWHALW